MNKVERTVPQAVASGEASGLIMTDEVTRATYPVSVPANTTNMVWLK